MSVPSGSVRAGPLDALARLHAALDDLLGLDRASIVDHDLPALVEGLIVAGHRLHAASLDAVGAFDAADLASPTRHRSTRRWLEHRTRASASQAAGLVVSARTVRDHLPDTRDALASGSISAAHVPAITHVVRTIGVDHAAAAEPILLDLARHSDPSVVRRAAAHLHAVLDPDGAQSALDKVYARRGVTLSVVGTRAYLDGVLDVEAAETLHAALAPLMTRVPGDDRSAPQRRADALTDLARRALDADDLPTLGGQRPHLSVVVEARALDERRGAATLPWTGTAVPVATVLRWGCDAGLTGVWARLAAPVIRSQCRGRAPATGWRPLAVGRTSRTVTPAQLRALHVRDGGCAHPGCSRTAAYCDAHHVRHWADGGATDLDNLVLLCRHHHRTLHSGKWSMARPHSHETAEAGRGEPAGQWVAILPGGYPEPLQTATDRSPPLRPTG